MPDQAPARTGPGSRPHAWPWIALLGALLTVIPAAAPGVAPSASAARLVPAPAPSVVEAAALPRWTGGMDLYRPGVYSMQATSYWCTAAGAQIMRNIVGGQSDHSVAAQQQYFNYMRAHDRYYIPISDGSDPQGWSLGLARFVDARYRLMTYSSFDAAVRAAVSRLRLTQRPVAVAVMSGNHAWVLHGFTATADPAVTSAFRVTSVVVTGPLWGRQSRNGYDMPPDTRLSYDAFRRFFTPFRYAGVRMAWEGRWVTIQVVPAVPTRPIAKAVTPPPRSVAKASAVPRREEAPGAASVAPPTTAASPARERLDAGLVTSVRQAPEAVAEDADASAQGAAAGLGVVVVLVCSSTMVLVARRRRRAP